MTFLDSLKQNPFYILKASSLDTAEQLEEKVTEAVLLDGKKEAEKAGLLLFQPQERLKAEMNWFPGEREEGFVLTAFAGREDSEAMPEIRMKSTLGTVNAWRTVLEKWPVGHVAGTTGLCLCLVRGLSELDEETVLSELNRDRQISGFPVISEKQMIRQALLRVREEAMGRLMDRLGGMPREKGIQVMEGLASEYCGKGAFRKNPLLEEIVEEYAFRNSPESEQAEKELISSLKYRPGGHMFDLYLASFMDFPGILEKLERWNMLTHPLRRIRFEKGVPDQKAAGVEHRLRHFALYQYFLIGQHPNSVKKHPAYGKWKNQNVKKKQFAELVNVMLRCFFEMDNDYKDFFRKRADEYLVLLFPFDFVLQDLYPIRRRQ